MEHIVDVEKVLEIAKKHVDTAKLPDKNSTDSESFIRSLMFGSPSASRFDLFRDIQGFLDADGRAIALAVTWPDPSLSSIEPYAEGYCTKEEVIEWFASCNSEKLMGSINVKLLSRLPDAITVFRGVEGLGDLEPADAVSWTINPIIAIAYPDDIFGVNPDKSGYKATIKKEDVLAYFWNADMEIILKPDKLFNVKYIDDMAESLSGTELDLVREQNDWHYEYFNNKVYHDLLEKLEPLGRVNELIEATMDFEKRAALVKELLGFSL